MDAGYRDEFQNGKRGYTLRRGEKSEEVIEGKEDVWLPS